MTNYEVIETLINYNKEYNHVDGHSPEELDKADKKSMLRTRKGLMLIRYALEDYKYENQLDNDFTMHLSMLAGNFHVLWLYGKYLGREDFQPIETKYNIVRSALRNKFVKVYASDKFEESWNEIAKELKINVEPRLNSNQVEKDYKGIAKYSNLSKKFINWHKSYNHYDYKLFEEFCT